MYDYENSPEPDLIRQAKRGDVKAFSQLYARIYRDLYRFALYMTRHRQDAEDAVSETVVTAYEKISGLRKEESFRSWMFTILNHQCKKILRSGQKELAQRAEACLETGEPGGRTAGHRAPESHEPDYAQWHDVRRAFDDLDEEERMIVAFSVFGGYRSDEIAQMLDKNAATVRSRKSRALEKMRNALS